MPPDTVKSFDDGSSLEFDTGKFDRYCVYERRPDETRFAPRDTDYFETLEQLGTQRGPQVVYEDFVRVYERTGATVSKDTLVIIDDVSAFYGSDACTAAKAFTTIYMGMIAEENKAHTKLGKRVKRLGIHVLLEEGRSIEDAANFMRGMKWREIDAMCRERGF